MSRESLILLVDDEPKILKLYSETLKDAGFNVVTATNGKEGVEAAKKEMPDLILMDVKMPVMDGVEAMMELKKDPATASIKAVFLTAFSDPNSPQVDVNIAKEMGAADFIRKGISLDEFVEQVKRCLK